jgi:hypothetical protein
VLLYLLAMGPLGGEPPELAVATPDRRDSARTGTGKNGAAPPRWLLIVKPEQRELFEILRARLGGSGVEVLVERRGRERRKGGLGAGMDRRVTDRRRQRPVALLSAAVAVEAGAPGSAAAAAPAAAPGPGGAPLTHPCPTCASAIELELPRFPHPPARVEMQVAHVAGSSRDPQHYVEIAAFTVSGRLILSQRVPGRRSL